MNFFKEFKIPCLQTFDELKKICKDQNLKLKIPNSTEKNFRELIKLKRERDELENAENGLKIKRLKPSPSISSDEENHDHNYTKNVAIIDLTLTPEKFIDKEDKEINKINPILLCLENRLKIETLMNFYNELNKYADNLNKELIKFKNTPIIVQNSVDNDLPPVFNYVNEYCLKSLDCKTLETIKSTVHRCECKYDCIELYSRNGSGCCYSKLSDDKCFYNSNGSKQNKKIKLKFLYYLIFL